MNKAAALVEPFSSLVLPCNKKAFMRLGVHRGKKDQVNADLSLYNFALRQKANKAR